MTCSFVIVSGQLPVEVGEQVVRPGVDGEDDVARAMDGAVDRLDLDLAADVAKPDDLCLVAERCPVLPGEALVRGIGADRVR